MSETKSYIGTHWGHYQVTGSGDKIVKVEPSIYDSEPSPIGDSLLDAMDSNSRVAQPAIRQSFLRGDSDHKIRRGSEAFVEVSWEQALDIASKAIGHTIKVYGNAAIYGGSYGWSSAGRFHHAQSQVHRFLNTLGGYTASVNSYSSAACDVLVGRILGVDYWTAVDGLLHHDDIAEYADLYLAFGGFCFHNNQVVPGGVGDHRDQASLRRCVDAGVEIVNISPDKSDMPSFVEARWVKARPGSDSAILLGLAHAVETRNRVDRSFLASHTVGYEKFRSYLLGEHDGIPKNLAWASSIANLPLEDLESLAEKLIIAKHPVITLSLAIQRAEHGEQPYWLGIVLACMLGMLGKAGAGVGLAWGNNGRGIYNRKSPSFKWASVPQGTNPIDTTIPVARITDMLEKPGGTYQYNGSTRRYPDIKLIYWAGGNPFHHHQDLNRLRDAWKKPDTVIVNEYAWTATARHADIVFPATTPLERDDIVCGKDSYVLASKKVVEPFKGSKNDFQIFSELSARLGRGHDFTEGRNEVEWIRKLYEDSRANASDLGVKLADFQSFWNQNAPLCLEEKLPSRKFFIEKFRDDPLTHPLATPSGKVEIFSETIASFGYADCAGHPMWFEKTEWLGGAKSLRFSLHLLSPQPRNKLHSQLDFGRHSRGDKFMEREVIRINPEDAMSRGIGDSTLVRVFNDRGSCLAVAKCSQELMSGVVSLPTGAWFDPDDILGLERHGNPNVLSSDIGTSSLAQGPTAHSCLVEVEPYDRRDKPRVAVFNLPAFTEI